MMSANYSDCAACHRACVESMKKALVKNGIKVVTGIGFDAFEVMADGKVAQSCQIGKRKSLRKFL
mgnify:CR=1 FL=1